jgi:hypothetical protein
MQQCIRKPASRHLWAASGCCVNVSIITPSLLRSPQPIQPWSAISLAHAVLHHCLASPAGGEQPRTQWFKRMTEQEPHTADEMLRCGEVEGCPPRLKLSELEEGDELVSRLCGIFAAAACVGRPARFMQSCGPNICSLVD